MAECASYSRERLTPGERRHTSHRIQDKKMPIKKKKGFFPFSLRDAKKMLDPPS